MLDLKFLVVDYVLQKSLLYFELFDFKPQIMIEKYATPTHLGE